MSTTTCISLQRDHLKKCRKNGNQLPKRSKRWKKVEWRRDWSIPSFLFFLACLCKTLDVKKINKNHKLTISAINICLSSFNGWHEAGLLFFFFLFFVGSDTLDLNISSECATLPHFHADICVCGRKSEEREWRCRERQKVEKKKWEREWVSWN